MKNVLCVMWFFCAFVSCNRNPVKVGVERPEMMLALENRDILAKSCTYMNLQRLDDKLKDLILSEAFKAVKLDTTKFRKTHFHHKKVHMHYFNNHSLVDSLLKSKYGVEILSVDLDDCIRLFEVQAIDTFFRGEERFMNWSCFEEIMYAIEDKFNYRNENYENAYNDERRIAFKIFKEELKSDKEKNKHSDKAASQSIYNECKNYNLEHITSIDPLRNHCDQRILQFCTLKNKRCWLVDHEELETIINEKVYNHIDTNKILPIVLNFDSLGMLSSVISNNPKVNIKLFDAFNNLSEKQRVKFLDEKYIGFTFVIGQFKRRQ